jgi:hypothetical protein
LVQCDYIIVNDQKNCDRLLLAAAADWPFGRELDEAPVGHHYP